MNNLQLLVSGVALGIVYGLVAMGMVLIFRTVGVMNFAQGNFLMFSGYVCYQFNQKLGLPMAISMFITIIVMGIMGILFQKVAYWPLRNAPSKAIVVSTMGAAFVLQEGARIIWGAVPLSMDRLIPGSVKLGSSVLQGQYIAIIIVSAVLMVFIYFLLEKTRIGSIMQATAQDQYMASLVGISVKKSVALTFFLSIAIAGIAGTLMTPIFFITTGVGTTSSVKAFAAIVIGGFGSIPGAIIGGIIVGLVEAFGGTYISSTYQLALIYVVLILVLIFRPQGLFGGKIQEKA